ncbi:zinc ribbon domain-containing protein, partial [Streptomyces niveus]|uniref:zinc ribbon domain-containing protein n=1 Tax=Streptomyces niveus TaxID=193462 RepID=UPI0036E213B0
INQGLFYLSWLMDHRAEFEHLVRDQLGSTAASQVLWSRPRLICIAGDFTRYDAHAVREHRRPIDLVRYRFFGSDLLGLETVASVSGGMRVTRRARQQAVARAAAALQGASMVELADAVDEALLGLGDGVNRVEHKQYRAYQRLCDRWFPSSRTCSACGWQKPSLTLAERVFTCGQCGLVIDRDLNAARNIAAHAVPVPHGTAAPGRVEASNARAAAARPATPPGVEGRPCRSGKTPAHRGQCHLSGAIR